MTDPGPTTGWLTSAQAATMLGISSSRLAHWRTEGKGPPFIYPEGMRSVRYAREDVIAYLTNQPRKQDTQPT